MEQFLEQFYDSPAGSTSLGSLPPKRSRASCTRLSPFPTDRWPAMCAVQGREFLVGAHATLADIVVTCDLYHGFTKVRRALF